jgi:hypothetical protein
MKNGAGVVGSSCLNRVSFDARDFTPALRFLLHGGV